MVYGLGEYLSYTVIVSFCLLIWPYLGWAVLVRVWFVALGITMYDLCHS
jgi:hypothetical protein